MAIAMVGDSNMRLKLHEVLNMLPRNSNYSYFLDGDEDHEIQNGNKIHIPNADNPIALDNASSASERTDTRELHNETLIPTSQVNPSSFPNPDVFPETSFRKTQ
ncbi:hypothetical protein SK128_015413 [Halocaridina rubra]|uniref:Uncharacterized protein n=1 Tax=Halocaridina rubra TaxID=373956 RepID=A0AAN8WJG7_HALRR